VIVSIPFRIPTEQPVRRKVLNYRDADWDGLRDSLDTARFDYIGTEDPSTSTEQLTQTMLSAISHYIPNRTIQMSKSTHPWVTDGTRELVHLKHEATGTEFAAAASQACAAGMLAECAQYKTRTQELLLKLRGTSKLWWTKARELLDQESRSSSTPALRNADQWAIAPIEKATLIANRLCGKFCLPAAHANTYSSVEQSDVKQTCVSLPQEDAVEQVLVNLDESSATGPDLVPARILKQCAKQLKVPLAALATQIIKTGT
jgi:hypothetical protein